MLLLHQRPYISITQTVAPTDAVISMEEAREHLRIIGTDEDGLIRTLRDAAEAMVQDTLNLQLVAATFTQTLEDFPGIDRPIVFHRWPLRSVASVAYLDTQGASQTLDASRYTVINGTVYGAIIPAHDLDWPDVLDHEGAENVTVTFRAGHYDPSADPTGEVPAAIKSAILLTLADLFENREASSTQAVSTNRTAELLISLYRVPGVA